VHCAQYISRLGGLSTLDTAQRLNNKPHFIADFPSGHNNICIVCNRKKNRKTTLLCCETSSDRLNEDFISVIVAKNTTLPKSTRKWNLHFHCHAKIHALSLSCFSVWSWWFFLKLCSSFFMQCINVHVYSWNKCLSLPKEIIFPCFSFTENLMLRKVRKFSKCGLDFVLHLMQGDENAKYFHIFT